ncbi:MAG TPA: phosphotransferase family protein [Acetobacteraceae bacterium]|nr:phosphotransferase family protein [Acetobacteraceae bacterium]
MSAGPELRSVEESVPVDWTRVRAELAAHGLSLDADPPPRQFAGGLANLNYYVHIGGKPYVLRRPPLGELPAGSHDMAREHRILSRLAGALAVAPRSIFLCTDPSVIGAPFQILEYRAGRVIRERVPADLKDRPGLGARLSEVVLTTLASIHAVDTGAIGLDDLGRPEGFLTRAVAGWRKRGWAAREEGTDALHAEIGAWLEQHAVPDGPPALLHNDFKLDNIILDPADLSAVAVLDWDQGTRGDPLFDFGTALSYWTEPGDPPAMFDMRQTPCVELGFPPRTEAVAAYARLIGRDMSDFLFHRVLSMYKLGVIFLQLGLRWRQGTTTDARYAPFSGIGTGIVAFTHDIARGRAF